MSSDTPDQVEPAPAAAAVAPQAAAPTSWWRRALPFVVAVALIAFTLRRIDLHAFAEHLAAVNAPAFLLFAGGFVLALLTADALATATVYRRTVAPVSFREFWVLRGASYLPSILNHHVGQAILTYYVSRRYGVSLARMAGGTLLVYASWMGCLLGAGSIAMVVVGWPLWQPALVLGAGVVYLAIIAWRPARLSSVKLLAPLFEAGLAGHLVALLVRLPHFAVLFLGTWLPFLFFGVNIPLAAALTYVPILMVAVTLPITPQGVGTRALLAVTFFSRFAPGVTAEAQAAAIAASTTSFEVAFTLVEVLLGIILLRRAMPAMEAKAQSG
jgi:Lysylphosphatidylglycerol synthase TM region